MLDQPVSFRDQVLPETLRHDEDTLLVGIAHLDDPVVLVVVGSQGDALVADNFLAGLAVVGVGCLVDLADEFDWRCNHGDLAD